MSKQQQIETFKQAVYDFENGYCSFLEAIDRLNQMVTAEDMARQFSLDIASVDQSSLYGGTSDNDGIAGATHADGMMALHLEAIHAWTI